MADEDGPRQRDCRSWQIAEEFFLARFGTIWHDLPGLGGGRTEENQKAPNELFLVSGAALRQWAGEKEKIDPSNKRGK
jgi:hypothetical protein